MSAEEADELHVAHLFEYVDLVLDPDADTSSKRNALDHVSIAIQPAHLGAKAKQLFVQRVAERNVVDMIVSFIEHGGTDIASDACDFLGDLSFNSDLGTELVLKVFHRIIDCFRRACATKAPSDLVRSFVSLCANIVALNPRSHSQLIPLVRPVFLKIIQDPLSSDRLLSSTILLLANLAWTTGQDLKDLCVADALLELVLDEQINWRRKSVAESVIIFLLGHEPCGAIDRLIEDLDVIQEYCIPILQCALDSTEFRGMYPHLLYSAQLFYVLSRSRLYAQAIVLNESAVPLLLQACLRSQTRALLESDGTGRCLALKTLRSLVHFGLWPTCHNTEANEAFVAQDLPRLLEDEHAGVRSAAAAVWGHLNTSHLLHLVLVGHRLEARRELPLQIWNQKILAFNWPFVADGGA